MRPVTLILLHMPPCYGASLTRYYGSPDLFRTHLALASGGGGEGGQIIRHKKKPDSFLSMIVTVPCITWNLTHSVLLIWN
jgi:hypothetical protein